MKHEDLSQIKFGKLTVVSYAGINKNRQALWNARCQCGTEFVALASKLKQGRTTSCGCGAANKSPPMIGRKFGKLTVLAESGINKSRAKTWLCLCECGKETVVAGVKLRNGHTRSCGCLVVDKVSKLNLTHGLSSIPEYVIWAGMWQRVTNPNNISYPNYGQRGVKICDRWKDFNNFLADMGTRPQGKYSIERVDNDGNYEPTNCKWADYFEQAKNKRKRKEPK